MSVTETEPRAPKGLGRLRQLTKGSWAIIVAAVALLGSALSIVFQIFPDLKPDPRDHVAASLSVFAVDPNVTLGEFLDRAHPGDRAGAARSYGIDPTGAQMGFPGEAVYVRTQVDGFKHSSVKVLASLYNARTQERVPIGELGGQNTFATTLRLDSPSSSSVQLFFVPDLTDEVPTTIRVEMYDDRGMLAVADSPVLRHGRAPLP